LRKILPEKRHVQVFKTVHSSLHNRRFPLKNRRLAPVQGGIRFPTNPEKRFVCLKSEEDAIGVI
jgi:hypothetical protein